VQQPLHVLKGIDNRPSPVESTNLRVIRPFAKKGLNLLASSAK
jgi:hypothetical protein